MNVHDAPHRRLGDPSERAREQNTTHDTSGSAVRTERMWDDDAISYRVRLSTPVTARTLVTALAGPTERTQWTVRRRPYITQFTPTRHAIGSTVRPVRRVRPG